MQKLTIPGSRCDRKIMCSLKTRYIPEVYAKFATDALATNALCSSMQVTYHAPMHIMLSTSLSQKVDTFNTCIKMTYNILQHVLQQP